MNDFINEFNKNVRRQQRSMVALVIAQMIIGLSLMGIIGYVAAHFLIKYW